jgi:hypothetical protein
VRSAVRPGVARARSPCKSCLSRSAACLGLHRPFPPSWTPGGRRGSARGRRASVPAVRAIAGAGSNRRPPGCGSRAHHRETRSQSGFLAIPERENPSDTPRGYPRVLGWNAFHPQNDPGHLESDVSRARSRRSASRRRGRGHQVWALPVDHRWAGSLAVASPGFRVPASCSSQQRWKVLLQEW